MCLRVIECGIVGNTYDHVNNFIMKAESYTAENPSLKSKLRAASGLHAIKHAKYQSAAGHFLNCSIDHKFTHVLTHKDVAVYGTLCALASFQRDDLKAKLIDNA